MIPKLMTVRVPYEDAIGIASNDGVLKTFGKPICLTTHDHTPAEAASVFFDAAIIHRAPLENQPEESEEFVFRKMRGNKVTHAIISQPLFWYSECAGRAARRAGAEVIWFERFPGGNCIFDKIGCQYTSDSDLLRYGGKGPFLFPKEPHETRLEQPGYIPPRELVRKYDADPENTIVLFGQSHLDMSLVDHTDRLHYELWVTELVERNRNTTFLYKRHPLYGMRKERRDPLAGILGLSNVKKFDESIFSAFDAFRFFAAYSSTVILEGAFRGKAFITGGRHFLDKEGLCLRAFHGPSLNIAVDRLRKFSFNWKMLIHRLGFITRRYTLPLLSGLLAKRIELSSEQFFSMDTING